MDTFLIVILAAIVLLVIVLGLAVWTISRSKQQVSGGRSQRLALGLSLGLAIGGGLGIVLSTLFFDDLTMGIVLGAGGGMLIGLALGSLPEKRRDQGR